MQIKFLKNISQYSHLVMFDLASKTTGVCLYNIKDRTVEETRIIHVSGISDSNFYELYQLLDEYFAHLMNDLHIDTKDILVYKEAMPTQLRGSASTVQTFLALAKSHAVLEIYLYKNNIDIYDNIGVYPISTHSYLKKINNWDNKHKVEKKDIQQYVYNKYNLELTSDEADAVFLAQTFLEVKYNKDINEEIKEVKKHMKTLKSENGRERCQDKIDFLFGLMY